jgi:hypothetical protein
VVALLAKPGPGLAGPLLNALPISRHPKELQAGTRRTLFAFDPHQTAILLLSGGESDIFNLWYERSITLANDLYDEHLDALDDQETMQWRRGSLSEPPRSMRRKKAALEWPRFVLRWTRSQSPISWALLAARSAWTRTYEPSH